MFPHSLSVPFPGVNAAFYRFKASKGSKSDANCRNRPEDYSCIRTAIV